MLKLAPELAKEFRKMGETMAVAEISSEIKRGFRGIALMIFACAFLLCSTAFFIASYFADEKGKLILSSIIFAVFTFLMLLFYLKSISVNDKEEIPEAGSLEIEIKDNSTENRIVNVESREKERKEP